MIKIFLSCGGVEMKSYIFIIAKLHFVRNSVSACCDFWNRDNLVRFSNFLQSSLNSYHLMHEINFPRFCRLSSLEKNSNWIFLEEKESNISLAYFSSRHMYIVHVTWFSSHIHNLLFLVLLKWNHFAVLLSLVSF